MGGTFHPVAAGARGHRHLGSASPGRAGRHGPFHAIAAWQHSGVKPDEQELIGSGHYRVLDTSWDGGTLVVDLQELSLITSRR